MATNKNIKINLDYSEFTGGIKECQSKMNLLTAQFKNQEAALGSNASKVDMLTLSESTLTQKIQLQSQVVDQAAAKLATLATSEGATSAQVDRAQAAFLNQSTKLQQLQNELQSTQDELRDLASAESESANSAEEGSNGVESFSGSLLDFMNTASSVMAVIEQLGSQIYNFAKNASSAADDLLTLSTQTSVSADTLQGWGYAAIYVDTSVQTMTSSMARLTRNMGEVANGSDTAAEKFKSIGVSVTDAGGNLRSTEDVFSDVIDALGGMSNVAERDAAAMSIFGRSAQELNPLISAGSSALDEYTAKWEALGYSLSGDQLSSLNDLNNAFDSFGMAMQSSGQILLSAFAPAITSIVNGLTELGPQFMIIVTIVGGAMKAFSALAPILQLVTLNQIASSAAATANAAATLSEAGAETALAVTATSANAALLPQIATALALVAAFALLVAGIRALIEMFTEETDAANKAANATSNFANASSAATESMSGSGGRGTDHKALGGRVRGGSVWVGEQGAELVDLPMGSYVHNSTDSRNMSSTSHNIFNVSIDAKSIDDFNKVVNVFSGLSQSTKRGGLVNG